MDAYVQDLLTTVLFKLKEQGHLAESTNGYILNCDDTINSIESDVSLKLTDLKTGIAQGNPKYRPKTLNNFIKSKIRCFFFPYPNHKDGGKETISKEEVEAITRFNERTIVKLFFGFVEVSPNLEVVLYDKNPHQSTLDVLALYVGYLGYNGFKKSETINIGEKVEVKKKFKNSIFDKSQIKKEPEKSSVNPILKGTLGVRDDEPKGTSIKPKTPTRNKLVIAIICAILLGLLSVLFFNLFYTQKTDNNVPLKEDEEIKPVFDCETPTYKSLFIPFNNHGTGDEDICGLIHEKLRDEHIRDSLELEFLYWEHDISNNFSIDSARYWKNFHCADLFVYGSYQKDDKDNSKEFKLFYIANELILPPELSQKAVSEYIPFELFDLVEVEVLGTLEFILQFFLAYINIEMKQYDKALSKFLVMRTEFEEHSCFIDKFIGTIYYFKGDYEQAKKYMGKYNQTHTECLNLGAISLLNRNYSDAVTYYSQVVQEDSCNKNALFNLGSAYLKLKEFQNAKVCLEKYNILFPQSYNTKYSLGLIQSEVGNDEEALKQYFETVQINPDFYPAWAKKGEANSKLGNYDEALEDYKKAINIYQHDHEIWYQKGILHEKLGELDKALESYQKVKELKPDDFEIQNKMEELVKKLRQFRYKIINDSNVYRLNTLSKQEVNSAEDDTISFNTSPLLTKHKQNKNTQTKSAHKQKEREVLIKKANEQHQLGNFEVSSVYLDSAITFVPGINENLVKQGIVYLNSDNLKDALICFNKAYENNHTDYKANYYRGIIHLKESRFWEAYESFFLPCQIRPDIHYGWFYKGVTELLRRLPVDAIESFNNVLLINPRDYEAWMYRGLAFESLSQDDALLKVLYDKKYFLKYKVYLNLIREGKYKESESYKFELYEKIPNLKENIIEMKSKYFNEAISSYDKAIELNPNYYEAFRCKGFAYLYKYKDREEAIKILNEAIKIKQDFFQAWMDKGWVNLELENRKEAINCFTQVIKMGYYEKSPSPLYDGIFSDESNYVVQYLFPNYSCVSPEQWVIEINTNGLKTLGESSFVHRIKRPEIRFIE